MIPIDDPQNPSPTGLPLLRLGFRPFYLLAALLAVLTVPLWILTYRGLPLVRVNMPAMLWHGHEMLYGFAAAVISGFLFTAVRNWTNQPTPTGTPLALIALLWLAGRIAPWLLPLPIAAVIDLAFLPVVAVALARPLLASGNHRNYFVPLLLLGLTAINAWFYLEALGVLIGSAQSPLVAALGLITVLETIMAGRVIPMFTRNAIKGVRQYHMEWLETWLPRLSFVTMACFVGWPDSPTTLLLALTATLAHAWRWWGWRPLYTARKPILWILHLAYAWLIFGFLCIALAASGKFSVMLPIHVLAVGGMSGLIIGMITRTARGHTGRFLETDIEETLAYVAVMLAALARTLPLLFPALAQHYLIWLGVSTVCWCFAFLVYLLKYTPWLSQPRIDNQPG
jgi:uncharacterized protein involved in response to NO